MQSFPEAARPGQVLFCEKEVPFINTSSFYLRPETFYQVFGNYSDFMLKDGLSLDNLYRLRYAIMHLFYECILGGIAMLQGEEIIPKPSFSYHPDILNKCRDGAFGKNITINDHNSIISLWNDTTKDENFKILDDINEKIALLELNKTTQMEHASAGAADDSRRPMGIYTSPALAGAAAGAARNSSSFGQVYGGTGSAGGASAGAADCSSKDAVGQLELKKLDASVEEIEGAKKEIAWMAEIHGSAQGIITEVIDDLARSTTYDSLRQRLLQIAILRQKPFNGKFINAQEDQIAAAYGLLARLASGK